MTFLVESDIGLYEVILFGGLPGLDIIITSATFHNFGTYCNLKAALMTCVSEPIAFLGNWRSISPLNQTLELFFAFILFLISRGISFAVLRFIF